MDERIEAFLKDVVDLEGVDANTVHEGVRAYLAVYEDMVRDGEPERDKRDEAAKSWRKLCRERVRCRFIWSPLPDEFSNCARESKAQESPFQRSAE